MSPPQSNLSKSPRRWQGILLLILAGEAIFLLPFVLARVFRPTFLAVFELTNLELGLIFSVYGLVAIGAYLFGGPLADRFEARKLMAVAMISTAAGGFFMATIPSLNGLKVLYGFWGLTTILLFWAAMIRATREWGGENLQGRAFGLLDGGRGLVSALMGTGMVAIFALFLPESLDNLDPLARQEAFRYVILFVCGMLILVAGLVFYFLPANRATTLKSTSGIDIRTLGSVLRLPTIWFQALIILCAYSGYKITDDFSLLATEVMGYNEVEAASSGTLTLWMRPLVAILAGVLADRSTASRMTLWSFLALIFGALLVGSGILAPGRDFLFFFSLLTTCAGVFALRGLYFALTQEGRVPLLLTGTAVGLISVIGYTPDIFMGPLMGVLLDNNPGETGHQLIFIAVSAFGTVGFLATLAFRFVNKRQNA